MARGETVGITTNRDQAMLALAAMVVLEFNGVDVVALKWSDWEGASLQVGSRRDFDRAVSELGLTVGRRFGTIGAVQIKAVGMFKDISINIYGPEE